MCTLHSLVSVAIGQVCNCTKTTSLGTILGIKSAYLANFSNSHTHRSKHVHCHKLKPTYPQIETHMFTTIYWNSHLGILERKSKVQKELASTFIKRVNSRRLEEATRFHQRDGSRWRLGLGFMRERERVWRIREFVVRESLVHTPSQLLYLRMNSPKGHLDINHESRTHIQILLSTSKFVNVKDSQPKHTVKI